ncbi:flagellar protein FlaF [Methylobacterium sp. 1030]
MAADSAEVCRQREHAAFDRAIDLMASAGAADATAADRTEAISFVQRLWKLLIDDLVQPENALPEAMRADLISIGLWIIRQSDRILRGDAHGFDTLISVNATIRDGLR